MRNTADQKEKAIAHAAGATKTGTARSAGIARRTLYRWLNTDLDFLMEFHAAWTSWQILVLGGVRLSFDCNYDRLHYVANYDSLVRQLLGQPAFDMTLYFSLTDLKKNLPLLTEERLAQINAIIARYGRQTLQKKRRSASNQSR